MSLGDDHGYGGEQGSRVDDFGGTGQTRTRLPSGADTDIYGGARRPVRNSRSLIIVVGIVVLLIAAIAFANQSGDEGSPDETAKGAESAPTAATGVKPVKGKAGAIPTGYARDEQGAQSAAANYAVALGLCRHPQVRDRRHEIVSHLFVAADAGKLQTSLDAAYYKASSPSSASTPTETRPAGRHIVTAPLPGRHQGHGVHDATRHR